MTSLVYVSAEHAYRQQRAADVNSHTAQARWRAESADAVLCAASQPLQSRARAAG